MPEQLTKVIIHLYRKTANHQISGLSFIPGFRTMQLTYFILKMNNFT